MLNKFFKKESPILGLCALGGGVQRGKFQGIETSGGTMITNGGYTYHVFLASADFNSGKDTPGTVDIFLVGAGGGGANFGFGQGGGGGGGGGGIVNATSQPIAPFTTYPIVIGSGGGSGYGPGSDGGNTTGLSQTAYGGGGGGGFGSTGRSTNASGGGGGNDSGSGYSGGTGGPQGNPGGSGSGRYAVNRGHMGGVFGLHRIDP